MNVFISNAILKLCQRESAYNRDSKSDQDKTAVPNIKSQPKLRSMGSEVGLWEDIMINVGLLWCDIYTSFLVISSKFTPC